ncbi:MAG: cytochrome c oxidase subunit 3 [Burkholderiales bacterium]|nr:cytochrome c oxidase subunit 3 [Burkholderiales bacterium]
MSTPNAGGYFIPQPSYWPIIGSVALFTMASGFLLYLSGAKVGLGVLAAGFLILFYMLIGWFGKVIGESESGKYNAQVDLSFRWSMSWFIFSEVMFFSAFFGALYYARMMSVPWLGDSVNGLLWPDYKPGWPTVGPGVETQFMPVSWTGIPALNTALLLSSGVTITWAHHALRAQHRGQLILAMFLTIALGLTFLGFQVYEYGHAYSELNLKLTSGIYGTTFFMLTGFHGFHVTLGTIMLIVILLRCIKGHFTPDHHFAFEAVAWYWHFVDVVWLGLFIFVYVL